MNKKAKTARHYSHSFELKPEILPAKSSDRIALRILYPGMLCGFVLILLGLYELFNGLMFHDTVFDAAFPNLEKQNYHFLINPAFFDITIIIIGAGIIASLFMSYIRYRKIMFDGKKITIIDRQVGGKKTVYSEPLANYDGVQLRIEFFQFGFLNRNRYIIELRHKNLHKVAPLYISTSAKNIRSIWKHYAKTLNLPAVIQTDDGLVIRDTEDLDKSVRELFAEGKIANQYDAKETMPASIVMVRKKDKTVLKMAKICWDAYNLIAWFMIILAAGTLICSAIGRCSGTSGVSWPMILFYLLGAFLLIWAIMALFRKDKIVIKKYKFVVVHKFPLGNFKKDEISKDAVEAIIVSENPATGRYFLALSSNAKTIIFGKKLPAEDLKWVRKFLINNIVR